MLQEDIRDMFISEGVLNATGLRMCRLAKLSDCTQNVEESDHEESYSNKDLSKNNTKDITKDALVVLEKTPIESILTEVVQENEKLRKKPGPPKQRQKILETNSFIEENSHENVLQKPGPKSKKKAKEIEANKVDSDDESLSSLVSTESREKGVEQKLKHKRKSIWKNGLIKRKKKSSKLSTHTQQREIGFDVSCFTDKNYCFQKDSSNYLCRICSYEGGSIVRHFKECHPHLEVALSKISPDIAAKAIEQSLNTDFDEFERTVKNFMICRFCSKKIEGHKLTFEKLFWHIVSEHTGEYKFNCTECEVAEKCPLSLDIPNPPTQELDVLLGYICGECHFTQISLNNLKTHVALRHDNEETEVYTISLCDVKHDTKSSSRKRMTTSDADTRRPLRSRTDARLSESDTSTIVSNEVELRPQGQAASILSEVSDDIAEICDLVKKERDDDEVHEYESVGDQDSHESLTSADDIALVWENAEFIASLRQLQMVKQEPPEIKAEVDADIERNSNPHFMITMKPNRSYICRVPECNTNFRTPLLIALKRHVQAKHPDPWDGFCYICKQVESTGNYSDCLTHMLVNHLDEFPELLDSDINERDEENTKNTELDDSSKPTQSNESSSETRGETIKKYISVKPMSDLVSKTVIEDCPTNEMPIPQIQNIMSLKTGATEVIATSPSTSGHVIAEAIVGKSITSVAEYIKQIMEEKHPNVRDSLLKNIGNLTCLFKCAGRYCSYVTREGSSFVTHLLAHTKYERDNSDVLRCIYCSWQGETPTSLVAHVIKEHESCRYSCVYCWYLAATPLLVELHRAREHSTMPEHQPLELERKSIDQSQLTEGILDRVQAVKLYTCTRKSTGRGNCHFRSYTATKFREHLELHHSEKGDTLITCCICNTNFAALNALIGHLKCHGLGLFQCVYCLFGADTELELLEHDSKHHPARIPQAYLRHIMEIKDKTTKGAKKQYKALPLMPLGQQPRQRVRVMQIQSLQNELCPTQEAEKAYALEKNTKENVNSDSFQRTVASVLGQNKSRNQDSTSESNVNKELVYMKKEIPETSFKVISRKSTESPHTKISEDVICLDSDEEQPTCSEENKGEQNRSISLNSEVINLSDDDGDAEVSTAAISSRALRFGHDTLFKCQKCQTICKNDYHYRTHILKCYPNESDCPKCPHCPLVFQSRKDIRIHLIQNHGPTKTYKCSECGFEDSMSKKVVQHMKIKHEMIFVTIYPETLNSDKANKIYVVKPEEGFATANVIIRPTVEQQIADVPSAKPISKPGPKRSKKQVVPPQKTITRYGPEEMGNIPHNPIFDDNIHCSRCDFSTKVRTNLLRHLQMHANEQSVPEATPVNPVPHLESNEMHFDKMTNLAASSNTVRPATTNVKFSSPLPPESVARYPRYVPEKDRYVCGAVGCTYMSLDEGLLKYHWETLHSGLTHGGPHAITYRCVHCPISQQLDTSRPLTASRVVVHLKMHDTRLYGCSHCNYYHFQYTQVEKHMSEKHAGLDGSRVIVVREPLEGSPASNIPTVPNSVSATMDLKAWRCGICKYKSMLRPEVAEHCARVHGFKFQFKCAFCPFRGTVQATVIQHQTERHPGQDATDVLHIYYKERSLPCDEEGNPLWIKQRNLFESINDHIKAEIPTTITRPEATEPEKSPSPAIDLAIVKTEVEETRVARINTIEDAIAKYGQMCEPLGENYTCPLCKNAMTHSSKESFITHLHEELKYRRWGCSLCTYRTYSKPRITEHSIQEHKQPGLPVELSPDPGMELWIEKLIEYQDISIEAIKAAKKVAVPITPKKICRQTEPLPNEVLSKLIDVYGPFGTAKGDNFSCPKCDFITTEEIQMQEHLEFEIGKNRWACSRCPEQFQVYHQAQRHCSTEHSLFAHVTSLSKDSAQTAQWIECVLRTQRQSVRGSEVVIASEPDSLLVVRYEETAPDSHTRKAVYRKRKHPFLRDEDSDDEDRSASLRDSRFKCPHCDYCAMNRISQQTHTLRHYNMRPYHCEYCSFSSHKAPMENHLKKIHPDNPLKYSLNKVPDMPPILPVVTLPKNAKTIKRDSSNSQALEIPKTVSQAEELNYICLLCETELNLEESAVHHQTVHKGEVKQIVLRGDLVRRCDSCLALRMDADSLKEHHDTVHPGTELVYTMMRAGCEPREALSCDHCGRMFTYIRDLKCHHDGAHASFQLQYTRKPRVPQSDARTSSPLASNPSTSIPASIVNPRKRQRDDDIAPTRIAKKSTTKLPLKNMCVARKSTTKLPYTEPLVESSSDEEEEEIEFSYYGTKATPVEEFKNVQTKMPFFGKMMPVTVDKVRGFINICPIVFVEDFKRK